MMRRFLFPLALASAVLLSACNTSPDAPVSADGIYPFPETYSVSADGKTLLVKVDESFCLGDSEDNQSYLDSIPFTLSGNTLTFAKTDTLIDGSVIVETQVFKRSGSGSGLQGGVWATQSYANRRVSSDTLDADERSEAAMDSLFNSVYFYYNASFSNDTLYGYESQRLAEALVSQWNLYDTALDSVSASVVSLDVAQLKGLRTGEIVTAAYSADGRAVTYSSSVSGHAAFSQAIPSCPEVSPDWFASFFSGNAKSSSSRTPTLNILLKKAAGPGACHPGADAEYFKENP